MQTQMPTMNMILLTGLSQASRCGKQSNVKSRHMVDQPTGLTKMEELKIAEMRFAKFAQVRGYRQMAHVGDIFSIPLSNGQKDFGIIYICRAVWYIGVFDLGTSLEAICRDPNGQKLLLCGWTTDALVYHKRWTIEGKTGTKLDYPKPCYKIGIDGDWRINSFDESDETDISNEEADMIDYKSNFAPIAFQNALEDLIRTGMISAKDRRFTAKYVYDQVKICRNIQFK